jgi:hypothetical protein
MHVCPVGLELIEPSMHHMLHTNLWAPLGGIAHLPARKPDGVSTEVTVARPAPSRPHILAIEMLGCRGRVDDAK